MERQRKRGGLRNRGEVPEAKLKKKKRHPGSGWQLWNIVIFELSWRLYRLVRAVPGPVYSLV